MHTVLREIDGPAGKLEALLELPAPRGVTSDGLLATGSTGEVRAAVVFGHPHPQYGGTMHTKGVYHATKGLARIGWAVLRFSWEEVMFEPERVAGALRLAVETRRRPPRRAG